MRKAFTIIVLLLGTLLFGAQAALADHMTGRYLGTGELQGAVIDMQQSGRQVTGRISGTDNGTLQGQSDGGDNFRGTMTVDGVGQIPFEGRWTPRRPVADRRHQRQSGAPCSSCRPARAAITPPRRDRAATPAASASSRRLRPSRRPPYFYLVDGAQQGPVDGEQLRALIADGTINRQTLVWQPGQPEWSAIESIPELAALLPAAPPRRRPPLPPITFWTTARRSARSRPKR
jgi:hypothetical protein